MLILLTTSFVALFAYPFKEGDKILGLVTVPTFFTKFDYNLGLDLRGGTQLVYDIDLSKVPKERESDVINGVEEVIRRRVDGLGVSEPVIQNSSVGAKKHVLVELPGISDIQQAIDIVGKVVQLKFSEEKTSFTADELKAIEEKNVKLKEEATATLDKLKTTKDLTLEKAATDTKLGLFTKAGKDLVLVSSLGMEMASALESKDVKDDTLYPEIIESEDQYSIVYVDKIETTKENEVDLSHILVSFQGAERVAADVTRTKEEALIRAKEAQSKITAGTDFATASDEYSDDTVAKADKGELTEPIKGDVSPYDKDFTIAAQKLTKGQVSEPVLTPFGYHIIKARDIREVDVKKVLMDQLSFKKESTVPTGWSETALTGEHFDFASASFDPNTLAPMVNIQFNDKGKKLFEDITTRNLNKPIAIFLDDKPIIGTDVYAPTVQSKISDGKAVITGLRSLEEASQLAQNLNTGAIPAPISLIGQSNVGATLGHDAMMQALKAGLIGLIILALYISLYYRLSGLIAILALFIYAVLLSGVINLIGVTLTLAGLAGVILSIGMAVDANVLIFERMKEELALGKDLNLALDEGFNRAWSSIRDSNVSSLITCAILFMFGTGIIRGFALTLAIGILISMFTAITVTRTFLKIAVSFKWLGDKHGLFIASKK